MSDIQYLCHGSTIAGIKTYYAPESLINLLSLSRNLLQVNARRIVSCLLVAAYAVGIVTPVYADRIETRHTTQVLVGAQKVPDLQLREVHNYDFPFTHFPLPLPPGNEYSQPYFETVAGMDFSILSLQQDPQKAPSGDVDVAICDCGDLFVPVAGGFPKWPLLFLAGIPFVFLKGGEESLPPLPPIVIPGPNPTPSTQQTPVPEPTSLLLLLTGIGAVGLRLRKLRPWSNRNGKNDEA